MTKEQLIVLLDAQLYAYERDAINGREYIEMCRRAGARATAPTVWLTGECEAHGGTVDVVTMMSWSATCTERLLCGCLRASDLDACKIARQALLETP